MRDGIYRIQYQAPARKGTAVFLLQNGAFSGCGRSHFAVGTFKRDGNRITGELSFRRHSGEPLLEGEPDEFDVVLSGICTHASAEFEAYAPVAPSIKATGSITWLCGL